MVFIYHRLLRPHITDFESTPRLFRELLFKINRYISPLNRNYLKLSEPKYPVMRTNFPGPMMKNFLNDLELTTSDFLHIENFINYEKSSGNYFTDCDDNQFLDLANIGNNNVLGYNSKALFESYLNNQQKIYLNFVNKNDSINNYATADHIELLQETINQIKPKGIEKVVFTKKPEYLAFFLSKLRRGFIQSDNNDFNLVLKKFENNNKSVNNNTDNSEFMKNYLIPSQNFSHKRFNSDAYKILKICNPMDNTDYNSDIDTDFFASKTQYRTVPFPKLKYPLKENMRENYAVENKCLEETEKILKESFDISAMIIKPVENGEQWATPTYFNKLRKLASLYNVDFIVDERKTGMTVGTLWQHDLWNLWNPPDFVIFGNKFMNSGLFIRNEALPDKLYNFHAGYSNLDINNLFLLNNILTIIKENKLFEKSEKAGEYFKLNLRDLNKKIGRFNNIRGKASLIAFDLFNLDTNTSEAEALDKKRFFKKFTHYCRNSGIFIDGNPHSQTVYIRPNLIIQNQHYDKLLNVLEDVQKL